MNKKDLIGVWRLVTFKISWKDSQKSIYPYGEDAVGYLIYTTDDHVSVHIMHKRRVRCVSNDYKNLSQQEKMEMAENSGAYFGRFEISDHSIIHYPEISVFPNFIGTPQVRDCTLNGKTLTLECDYPGIEYGLGARSYLIWERVG